MEKTDLSLADWQSKAARYCATAEHCESEVAEKLYQWGTPQQWRDKIVDYLYENNYLNTQRYCRAYVHDKLLYQGWGRVKIRMMLQGKRLPAADIHEAIENIDETEYLQVLEKVMSKKKNATPEEVARYCMQRGFEWERISALLP